MSSTFGYLRLFVNDTSVANGFRSNYTRDDSGSMLTGGSGKIWLQAALQLNKDDKVSIKVEGHLYQINDKQTNYFESRLVSALE